MIEFPSYPEFAEQRRRARLGKWIGGAALMLGIAVIVAYWAYWVLEQ